MGLMYVGTIWLPAKCCPISRKLRWDTISPLMGKPSSLIYAALLQSSGHNSVRPLEDFNDHMLRCHGVELIGEDEWPGGWKGDKKVVGKDKIREREWNTKYLVVSMDVLSVYINRKVVITMPGLGEWSKYTICIGEHSFARITKEYNISRYVHWGLTMRFVAQWLCIKWHQVGGLARGPNQLPEREGHGNNLGSHGFRNQWWCLGAQNCPELTLNSIEGVREFLVGLDSEEWEQLTWTCWHVAQNLRNQSYPRRSPPNPTSPTTQK